MPTLTKYKVKKINSLFLTSLKPQCIGGAEYIISYLPVENIYLPQNYTDVSGLTYYSFLEKNGLWYYLTKPYDYEPTGLYIMNYRLSKILKKYHKKIKIVSKKVKVVEENINGTKFKLTLISPPQDYSSSDIIGNNSYAVHISYGNNSVLIMSQLGYEAQEYIIKEYRDKLKSKIMLLPQNGNFNVFNKMLIETVSPEIAVCQYGWTNQRIGFFHSSLIEPTIKLCLSLGIKVYRTDFTGAVICKLWPDKYEIKTVIPEKEYRIKGMLDIE